MIRNCGWSVTVDDLLLWMIRNCGWSVTYITVYEHILYRVVWAVLHVLHGRETTWPLGTLMDNSVSGTWKLKLHGKESIVTMEKFNTFALFSICSISDQNIWPLKNAWFYTVLNIKVILLHWYHFLLVSFVYGSWLSNLSKQDMMSFIFATYEH